MCILYILMKQWPSPFKVPNKLIFSLKPDYLSKYMYILCETVTFDVIFRCADTAKHTRIHDRSNKRTFQGYD